MQKNGKKLLAWMLAASMVFSFSMPTQAAKKKPALSKKKAVITVGKTLTLKVKNIRKKPSNISYIINTTMRNTNKLHFILT